jgi:nitrile hydratase accessory protein
MEGPGALPRSNGELIFNEPWEARAFGMAVAMESQGTYQWEDFRSRLIKQISQDGQQDAEPEYYQQWFAALEDLAVSFGFVTEEELDRRTQEIASSEEH